MATVDELTQQIQDRENELFAANREVARLQAQLDESRERESNLASEHQADNLRNNDRIRVLSQQTEEFEAQARELNAKLRELEEARRNDETNYQRLDREFRSASLDLHAKEGELADLLKKHDVLLEAQQRCEALKKRVAELEEMHKEGKEEYKAEAIRAQELADKLSKKEAETEKIRNDLQKLSQENESLRDEIVALNESPVVVEVQQPGRAIPNLNLRSNSNPPAEDNDLYTKKRLGEKLEVNTWSTAIGFHDDELVSRTPRRGSIIVHNTSNQMAETGYAEPLLKDSTMVGAAPPAVAPSKIEKGTQTISQMQESPRGHQQSQQQGCPQACVIM